jgi:P27 family predicted phage terminase small subunit
MLQEQGILTPLDLPALEVFCSIYETWRGAQEAVFARVEDPETGRTRRRTMTEYAAGRGPHDRIEASVMRECWQAFRLWCSEFGLTPSARSGLELPAPEAKEEDIIEKMFRESEQE